MPTIDMVATWCCYCGVHVRNEQMPEHYPKCRAAHERECGGCQFCEPAWMDDQEDRPEDYE